MDKPKANCLRDHCSNLLTFKPSHRLTERTPYAG